MSCPAREWNAGCIPQQRPRSLVSTEKASTGTTEDASVERVIAGMSRKTVALVWMMLMIMTTCAGRLLAQGTATDTSHSVTVTTSAAGKLHVVQATATLIRGAALFSAYSTGVTLQYYARTLSGGQITVQATSDFAICGSPATAPSVACNTVHYTCGSASFGTACVSTQTLSTTSSTPVIALPSSSGCTNGGSPCGAANPFSVPLTFTLSNDPNYKTGTYTATVQFTISAI